ASGIGTQGPGQHFLAPFSYRGPFPSSSVLRRSIRKSVMGIIRSLASLLLLALSLAAAENADAQVRVNGVTIPQSRIELAVKNAVAKGETDSPLMRARIRDEVIARELLAQEAEKSGIGQSAELADQMERLTLQKQNLLIEAYLQNLTK